MGAIVPQIARHVVAVFFKTHTHTHDKSKKMRFVLFTRAGAAAEHRVGVLVGDASVADVSASASAALGGKVLSSMREFLTLGAVGEGAARTAIADASFHVPRAAIKLIAPIVDPEKVICVGMNYKDHCEEQGLPVPVLPVIFNKFASCICGDGDVILKSPETTELDYEVELVIVMGAPPAGRTGKHIPAAEAYDFIAGERSPDLGMGIAHAAARWLFSDFGLADVCARRFAKPLRKSSSRCRSPRALLCSDLVDSEASHSSFSNKCG